jgi:hypothetical protein
VHTFLDDPNLPPLEHVVPYVEAEKERLTEIERKRWTGNPTAQDEPSPSKEVSGQEMLDRARLLIAMELGKDPLLRSEVRGLFKESAQLSCLPTEKGLIKVDEHHPFYVCFKLACPYFLSPLHLELQILAQKASSIHDEGPSVPSHPRC